MTDLHDLEPVSPPRAGHTDPAPRSAAPALALGAAGFGFGVLALAAVAATTLGYVGVGTTADSALARRLDEMSAEIAALKQATDANAALLADRQRQAQTLSDTMASLTRRLELSQIQVAEKLGSLSREVGALQDATASTAAQSTGARRR